MRGAHTVCSVTKRNGFKLSLDFVLKCFKQILAIDTCLSTNLLVAAFCIRDSFHLMQHIFHHSFFVVWPVYYLSNSSSNNLHCVEAKELVRFMKWCKMCSEWGFPIVKTEPQLNNHNPFWVGLSRYCYSYSHSLDLLRYGHMCTVLYWMQWQLSLLYFFFLCCSIWTHFSVNEDASHRSRFASPEPKRIGSTSQIRNIAWEYNSNKKMQCNNYKGS